MPTFRCSWCQARSEHPHAGVLVVCPECGIKFNAIDWGAKKASMTHDFKRGDRVLIKSLDVEARIVEPMRNTVTCEYYDEQDKLHTIFCSPAAIVHAAKSSPEEPMTHQFAIGDLVRLNGTNQEGKVVGFSPRDRSLLLCDWVGDSPTQTYVPSQSVTLIGPNRDAQAEPNHPSKVET